MRLPKYYLAGFLILGLSLLCSAALARPGHIAHAGSTGKMHEGKQEMVFRAISRHLVHPGMLAFHQKELNLTQEQKEYIKTQIKNTQTNLATMEWDLAEAVGGFVSKLELERVDEDKALKQLDLILDIENSIKKERLGLMIRIKNKLTSEQLKKIEQNRKKWRKQFARHRPGSEKCPSKSK